MPDLVISGDNVEITGFVNNSVRRNKIKLTSSSITLSLPIEEVKKWTDENAEHFPVYLFADDLKFFHHSGRVNGLSAVMGSILGIRPIIHIDSEGHFIVLGKERGRMKALQRIMDYIDELGDNIKEHRVIIGQADCSEIADKAIEMLRSKYGDDLKIEVIPVNPTAGSHCGPDTLGISFYAKHR